MCCVVVEAFAIKLETDLSFPVVNTGNRGIEITFVYLHSERVYILDTSAKCMMVSAVPTKIL